MTTLSQQIAHLQKDKVLRKVIASVRIKKRKKDTDLYLALMRAVVGQQLSVKAAQTIWKRFIDLFKDGYPTPQKVTDTPDEILRSVGLSYQKASYVKNIAAFSVANTLDYQLLKKKDNEDLINYLVSIKGVGRWTVEMILMFHLQREDIFPKDDLGIQNGIRMLYNIRDTDKKKFYRKMDLFAENWKPYRTLACMYIWKFKDQKKEDAS